MIPAIYHLEYALNDRMVERRNHGNNANSRPGRRKPAGLQTGATYP